MIFPASARPLATALVATIADLKAFLSAQLFSSDRLVPKQHSSVGKDRLGIISKQGRSLLRSQAQLAPTSLC